MRIECQPCGDHFALVNDCDGALALSRSISARQTVSRLFQPSFPQPQREFGVRFTSGRIRKAVYDTASRQLDLHWDNKTVLANKQVPEGMPAKSGEANGTARSCAASAAAICLHNAGYAKSHPNPAHA